MATFDMTLKSTTGVSANSIASNQVTRPGSSMSCLLYTSPSPRD